jgi:hypothetical protein
LWDLVISNFLAVGGSVVSHKVLLMRAGLVHKVLLIELTGGNWVEIFVRLLRQERDPPLEITRFSTLTSGYIIGSLVL